MAGFVRGVSAKEVLSQNRSRNCFLFVNIHFVSFECNDMGLSSKWLSVVANGSKSLLEIIRKYSRIAMAKDRKWSVTFEPTKLTN